MELGFGQLLASFEAIPPLRRKILGRCEGLLGGIATLPREAARKALLEARERIDAPLLDALVHRSPSDRRRLFESMPS